MKNLFLLLGCVFLGACATAPRLKLSDGQATSATCQNILEDSLTKSADLQLDQVSDLYSGSCFNEVITLGTYVRHQYRSKFYEISGEVAELITPEGTFTSYVLESYERTYLSLLISMSYLNLQQEGAALVELRRAQEEETAFLYNYGRDPALSFLQAALWDRFDPGMARPHWKFLAEKLKNSKADASIGELAVARLREIDLSPSQKVEWRIIGLGVLPDLDWSTDFLTMKKGAYKIQAKSNFPESCSMEEEALISTSSWVDKISEKYSSSYHPLLLTKSLFRLPVALGYGIVGVSTGVAVGVGGCGLALYGSQSMGNEAGKFCRGSVELAGYLINQSTSLVEYTLKPDLRHWRKVPLAFYLSRAPMAISTEPCLVKTKMVSMKTIYLIN